VAVGNQVDEDELEDELEQMQQEQLDEQMTKTGTVPVSDTIHKLPAAANGPRKSFQYLAIASYLRITIIPGASVANHLYSQGQGCGGRRRRGGAPEAAGRDGHVDSRRDIVWFPCSAEDTQCPVFIHFTRRQISVMG
jgi:hypothetical protein